MLTDTIAALSTPPGKSGIGIIRISGEMALEIADKIFKRKDHKSVYELGTNTINWGWIIDPFRDELIDEVLLSIFIAPRSYTREDMIEINCHGNLISLNKVLEIIVQSGARLAERGEFTKRAYLNGRIDLPQAEAVLEIINADCQEGLRLALNKIEGGFTRRVKKIRAGIEEIIVDLNAHIDFDEYIDSVNNDHTTHIKRIDRIIQKINSYIKKNGFFKQHLHQTTIAICGKPNVGKSTLINKLYGEDKVITSTIPGTTRDCIQLGIEVDKKPIILIDTAGIRKERSKIERVSIERSKKEIEKSTLAVMVFDLSRRLDTEDSQLIHWLRGLKKEIIWVANKCDLKQRSSIEEMKKITSSDDIVEISAIKGFHVGILKKIIQEKTEKLFSLKKTDFFLNPREEDQLKRTDERLRSAKGLLKENWYEEVITQELMHAIDEIDKLIGEKGDSSYIEDIFKDFCIGK